MDELELVSENKGRYEYTWLTKEQLGEGWYEMRNGMVYHHNFSRGDIVRYDEHGNYLVRREKRV